MDKVLMMYVLVQLLDSRAVLLGIPVVLGTRPFEVGPGLVESHTLRAGLKTQSFERW